MDRGSREPPAALAVTSHVEEYRPGRLVEVLVPEGAQDAPVVLLWHGSGPDERDALVPLAAALAAHGVVALVPDWRSDDASAGPGDLLASIDFAADAAAGLGGDPERVVLAGWSLGANAAADVALHPDVAHGWHPTAVVGLGGGYDRTPFDAGRARDPLADSVGGAGRPAFLAHGISDNLIPIERSVVATAALAEAGWRAVLRQVDTDHAGVIGTVYDRQLKRCVPSDDPGRRAALMSVARQLARLALGPDGPVG